MFENPILMTISASALLASPVASVFTSVRTYQNDERPTTAMPIDEYEEYEKTKPSFWAPVFFGLGASYAICAVASFISLTVLSYVLIPLPLISSIIGAFFARLFSKTKSGDMVQAIFGGFLAGSLALVISAMLGALGLNGHL